MMKTKKEVEEVSGVTLNHFAEGKTHKTLKLQLRMITRVCSVRRIGPWSKKFGLFAPKFIVRTLSLLPCHRELLCD